MSYVTDIILIVDILEEENKETGEYRLVKRLNAEMARIHPSQAGPDWPMFVRVDKTSGGGKVMQASVFQAAINFLDEVAFWELLRSIPWEHPENLQIVMKRENETLFTLYHLPGPDL